MARENEKVVGTRLNEVDQEALEMLAVFHDQTVGALLRTAVREFIEKEQRHIYPLSLEAAVSLGADLKTETSILLGKASQLANASYGDAGGVYLLVHQETRELYVGSSTELTARLTHHKFSIKTGTHKNQSLNSWVVDEVVVVILESCEAVKNAAGKKALLAREQHYIDTLKLSKDWTLLNLADASTNSSTSGSSSSSSGRRLQQVVVSPPSKEQGVHLSKDAAPSLRELEVGAAVAALPSAFEMFYSTVIEQSLLPVLQEQSASRDVVRLFEGCNEVERGWFLEFLHSYDSPWLNGLASGGKFPWVSRLLEQVSTLKN